MGKENKKTEENPQNVSLNRKSKILFIIIGVLLAGSVAATYWRYMIKRDYIVQAQTDCDPTTQKCFIWKCNPNSTDKTEQCTGDPEKDIWYYKIIRRNAKNIPLCDPNDKECQALVCGEGEKDCSEELCTAENVKAPDTCNDPVQYNIDNPPEESEECAPDDQECLDSQSEEECAPDDQECLDAQSTDETCAPDDESCQQDGGNDATDTAPQPQ